MQDIITLVCTECKNENYISKKNKRKHPDRIELNKYCSKCNKAVAHREKKK
ncbi:MAG: 50S ribosomal protein L33 [Mycoplasmatales bacterium]